MSAQRIKGAEGVIIDSNYYLELPKAQTKTTAFVERPGMIRYNSEWKSFEGVLEFDDGSFAYRRFASLDENGQLLTSLLPDYVTSGMNAVGTYSPISDDIDPPTVSGQFDKLPEPTVSNSGNYYIVRGLMDAAQVHYNANTPSTSPVTFTPSNPSSAGNWLEIKYYFSTDPFNTSTNIVVAAFGRIITANIPSTGHEGLVSLSSDTELTTFSTSNDRSQETALSDSDWVISTGVKQQRLRQNRVSVSSGAVLYDRTFMNGNNRSFSTNTGTVQNTLDNLVLDSLRRTGDSMYDDGTTGSGRFGLIYGSATEPALTFNTNPFDPVNNPGNDPSKWSDSTTGIFHPATGNIGFSSSGIEKLRVTPTQLILYTSTGSLSSPSILFSNSNNNNLGILASNNIIQFVSNGASNVTLAQGLSTFSGNVNITGNSILGDAGTDTLTVNATSTFSSPITVNASSTFNSLSTFNNALLINNGTSLTFAGSTNNASIYKSTTVNSLEFSMSGFDDIRIMDGSSVRTKFNQYGIKLPVLSPVDNSVGENGMIAYSSDRNTVMQKTGGQWVVVGSGGGVATSFSTSDWVLNGSNYNYTIPNANILSVTVQESSGSNYSPVEVDTIVISPTNAVLSVPASPDLRFSGRVIVQYQ